ncbi:MAG: hypothetical protein E6Q36_08230 [Chryseobacterium sp.]|nr:MAG: hypothetical protein E6Q36_08230 [Chryseobacterium sp.]
MIPRILDYDPSTGSLTITENAYMQPELKALIDKYGDKVQPYLAYVYHWTAPDSPYINIPDEERDEAIIYDLSTTFGRNFDTSDPLLDMAKAKMNRLYSSPIRAYFLESQNELDRIKRYLQTNAVDDKTLKVRTDLFKQGAQIVAAYKKLEKEADEELQQRLRGSAELGMY